MPDALTANACAGCRDPCVKSIKGAHYRASAIVSSRHESAHRLRTFHMKLSSFYFLSATRAELDAMLASQQVPDVLLKSRLVAELEDVPASVDHLTLLLPRQTLDRAASAPADAVRTTELINIQPYRPPVRVVAAGGYVARPGEAGPEILLIHRRGVWDLPKGKLDPGESVEQCARREVCEELGIEEVSVRADLGTTEHGYAEDARYCVKRTHWYLMRTARQRFIPQASEGITDVAWMALPEAIEALGFETLRAHARQVVREIARRY